MKKESWFKEKLLVMFMGGPETPGDPMDDILGGDDMGLDSPEDVDRSRNVGERAIGDAERLSENREELEAKAIEFINTNADFAETNNASLPREAALDPNNPGDAAKAKRAYAALYKFYPDLAPRQGANNNEPTVEQFDAAGTVANINSRMWERIGITQDFEDPMRTVRKFASRYSAKELDGLIKEVQTQNKCATDIAKAYR